MASIASGELVPTVTESSREVLRRMTPAQKEEFFLQALIATTKKVAQLESSLEQSQSRIGELSGQLEQSNGDLDSFCKSQNMTRLLKSEKKSEKLFAKHEDVWTQRVLSAFLQNNPCAKPEQIKAVTDANQEVRRQLREYLENYDDRNKGSWTDPSYYRDGYLRIRGTLIAFAKLTLKANPLIAWEELHGRVLKVEQKLIRLLEVLHGGQWMNVEKAANRLIQDIDIDPFKLQDETSNYPDYIRNPGDYTMVEDDMGYPHYIKNHVEWMD